MNIPLQPVLAERRESGTWVRRRRPRMSSQTDAVQRSRRTSEEEACSNWPGAVPILWGVLRSGAWGAKYRPAVEPIQME